jgi:hypothetical protein
MKLTEKLQLERLSRVEQLSRAEQAELLASPEAQALLKENAALAGVEWHSGEELPRRREMLARVAALAQIPQEEPQMSMIARWFAAQSWPSRIALGAGLVLVILLAAVFLPFERVPLGVPAWASTDGYKLTVPLEQAGASVPDDPTIKQAELEQLLVNWRKGYERNIGPLPEGFAQSVDLNTADGAPEAVIALLNADGKQLESLQKFMEEQPDFPSLSTEPHTWFTAKDGAHPLTTSGLEISINDRTFTFPLNATKEEIERQIKAWLAEEDPEHQSKVDVDVEDLGNGKSVSVKVEKHGGGRVSVSASSSSSSSGSSNGTSEHSSRHESSHQGSSSSGGGSSSSGGGGSAGGGGGGSSSGGSSSSGGGGGSSSSSSDDSSSSSNQSAH